MALHLLIFILLSMRKGEIIFDVYRCSFFLVEKKILLYSMVAVPNAKHQKVIFIMENSILKYILRVI